MKRIINTLLCSSLVLLGFNTFATTYTVMNTNDAGTGSFRQAVLDANANSGQDTIMFDTGTNGNTINLNSGVVQITQDLLILGNGTINTLIAHQATGYEGVTTGAGILLKIKDCQFIATIINNGLLKLHPVNTRIELSNCKFLGASLNQIGISTVSYFGSFGGSSWNLNNCSFENFGNTAFSAAAADSVLVENASFNNCAQAIRSDGNVTYYKLQNNSVFNSNFIGLELNRFSVVLLRNNTIASCATGLDLEGSFVFSSQAILENNIFYSSTIDVDLSDDQNALTLLTSTNIVGTCMPGSFNSTPCPTWYTSADPLLDLAGMQDNGGPTQTIAIQTGSPAINNANVNAPMVDQRGYLRPDSPDIGAYEFNGFPPCNPQNAGSFTTQPTALTICENDSILFTYGFTGSADSIHWQLSVDGGTTFFTDDPNVGDSLMVDSVDYSANGVYVRAIAYCGGSILDSTIAVMLTVDTIDVSTTLSGATITAIQPNATYQWLDCDNGNAPMVGATNATFTPTANGNYAVQVTTAGCMDTSACVVVNSVGIEDVLNEHAFKIFPNPTSSNFTIAHGFGNQPVQMSITSALGQEVYRGEMASSTQQFTLDGVPQGVYFVKLVQNGFAHTLRLVINE